MKTQLIHGDCLQRLKELPDNSVDSVVTDPPYGLSFMGKKWDYNVPSEDIWRECLRVLKPGGHLLAFAGTRTQHRMAVRIEDAGFEIRDMIAWVYGSGFPKSLDVSKAIDKAAGAERERIGDYGQGFRAKGSGLEGWQREAHSIDKGITAPATDAAKQWAGWGTALKPALEPITVARKPFPGTVAANVLEYGTGAINVDGCRVEGAGPSGLNSYTRSTTPLVYALGRFKAGREVTYTDHPAGRWPANLIHDGSDEVVGLFPVTTSGQLNPGHKRPFNFFSDGKDGVIRQAYGGDTGSAARFFYCAKASKRDRDEGLEGFGKDTTDDGRNTPIDNPYLCGKTERANVHPTVKPTDLMRYLCRLVTPPGGTVLDPFMGSGSTGKAAMLEGFSFIGIEREAEYLAFAEARIKHAQPEPELFKK